MIRNNPLGQKSQNLEPIQPKRSTGETGATEKTPSAPLHPQTDEGQSGLSEDKADLEQQPKSKTEPSQIQFADKSSEASNPPPQMQMADFDAPTDSNYDNSYFDPGVIALLDMVRDAEDKMVKNMLDMIQQSLDRARELAEENLAHFYQKIKPQMDKMEAIADETIQAEKAQNRDQLRSALNRYAQMSQDMQRQVAQAQGDPTVLQNIQNKLDLTQILNTISLAK